jgi:hypothetical protein
LTRLSSQIHVPAGKIDGYLDECRETQNFNLTGRVVGVNFGTFCDLPLVILGIYPQGNFSLPTGEDGLIKMGDRTPSTRLHFFYLKRLVSLVEDRKYMFDDFALFHLLIISKFILYDHSRARGLLSPRQGKMCIETE